MRVSCMLLLSVAACAPPDRAWLDLPGDETAKTILYSVREPTLRVFVHRPDRSAPLELPVVVRDGGEIEAAIFGVDLSLESGELARGEGGRIGQLSGLDGVYSAVREGNVFSKWAVEETMSDELSGFPISPVQERMCSELEGERLFLPTKHRANFIFPQEDSVVIGTREGRLFRVLEDAYVEIERPDVRLNAAAIDETGGLWFSSTTSIASTIWSATLDTELTLEHLVTVSATVVGFAVSRVDPLDLVAIDVYGAWLRYDQALGVREIHPPSGDRSGQVDMEVLAPGEVLAIRNDHNEIFRYRDGVLNVEILAALPTRMRGAGVVPGLGPMVTTYLDHAWVHDGDSWRLLGTTTLSVPTDFVPIEGGFLIGSDLGAVEEYAIDVGFCIAQVLPMGDATVLGAPFGGGAVFVSGYNRDNDLQVSFVKRREP